MKVRFLALGLLGLAACTPTANPQQNREAARAAVSPVIAETLGNGAQTTRATECILQSAGPSEISDLAAAAGQPTSPETIRLVLVIAQRPPAVTCLQQAAA